MAGRDGYSAIWRQRGSVLGGQFDGGAQAAARPVGQRELAAMRLHDGLRDRQPQPGAAGIAAARILDPVEWLEHFGEFGFGNARAVVVNGDVDRFPSTYARA